MSNAAAWIMNIKETLYVSVSQMELIHIINDPYYVNVPGAPDYCHNIIIWKDNILPVVNIACLVDKQSMQLQHNVVAVIIYRDHDSHIHYGGISLVNSPELEYVDNNQVCKLPDHTHALQDISISCFTCKKGREVPILDMSKLFSGDYSKKYIKESAG